MAEPASSKAQRHADVAAILAQAVRDNKILMTDATRHIRADLRRLQTNQKVKIAIRSTEAQRVIDEAARRGEAPPKNGSLDALHADHVKPLTDARVMQTVTTDQWSELLEELGEVVCVTARENYKLEAIENDGVTGWRKYKVGGIKLLHSDSGEPFPLPLDSADQ